MTINTKFTINDKVFILVSSHIYEAKVISIDFHYSENPNYSTLEYGVRFVGTNNHELAVWRKEEEIFFSEDDCINYAIEEYKKKL